MATKLTPKQEAFCLSYIETGNASEAHRSAGYGPNMSDKTRNEAASRLLADSKVLARVEALQAEHRKRHDVTVDGLTEELEQARAKAMTDPKGAGAAVTAIMGKAKLHGLSTEDRPNVRRPYGNMPEDELDRRIAELSGVEAGNDGR